MLSLGCEIATAHSHYIDNLFLDGNGQLVVAELKRGKSPRDVTAQAIDYGAFAHQLTWEKLDEFALSKHGTPLDIAYADCMHRPLVKTERPEHRLLIVAESFDQRVITAATYLINTGLPLTLLKFNYFDIGKSKLLEMAPVLGEIPEQQQSPAALNMINSTSLDDGHKEWLLTSLSTELEEIEQRKHLTFELRKGPSAIAFRPTEWPNKFGHCVMRIEIFVRQFGVSFSYKRNLMPELRTKLELELASDDIQLSAARLLDGELYTSVSRLFSLPDVGDTQAVDEAIDTADAFLSIIHPLVMEDGA